MRAIAYAAVLAVGCGTTVLAAVKRPAPARTPATPFNGAISVDGPAVWIDAKSPGRLVRLHFHGTAGERLGIGISEIAMAPESSSSLVVSFRGPNGERVESSRMACVPETDNHPIDTCGGEVTLARSGSQMLEVDTPFSAAARFRIALSRPATAKIAIDHEQTAAVKRVGQDAQFALLVPSEGDVAVSARDATPGRNGGFFRLRILDTEGKEVSQTIGLPELGASLPVRGGGRYTVEIDPANGKPGDYVVSARASREAVVDGPALDFATSGQGEMMRVSVSARAGDNLAVAVDGLAHHPDVDSNSRFALLTPDGRRIGFVGCLTHPLYGLRPHPCKFLVQQLPATGRYTVEVSPPAGAAVSGRLLVTNLAIGSIAPGKAVPLPALRPSQLARYTFDASAGERVAVHLSKVSAAPPGSMITLLLRSGQGSSMMVMRTGRDGEVTIPPQAIGAAGKYVVLVDPGFASVQSGEVSIDLEEGKPQ